MDKLTSNEVTRAIKTITVKRIRELSEAAVAEHYKKWDVSQPGLRPTIPHSPKPNIITNSNQLRHLLKEWYWLNEGPESHGQTAKETTITVPSSAYSFVKKWY